MLTPDQLAGRDDSHLEFREGVGLLPACWRALDLLRSRATEAGFDLQVASGFRSFERQLTIWNAKARGERPVYDDDNLPVNLAALDPPQRVHVILRYSALPGASRHHWGSDLDIFDAAAMPAGYQLQLSPQEVADDGLFGPLHCWLDEQLTAGRAEGFFRPYDIDRGGVAAERWHLSFAPAASECESLFTCELLREVLADSDLALRDAVLNQLPELHRRYVCQVAQAPATRL